MFKVILLTSILIVGEIKAANILGVFPTPSISHQIVFRPLMLELAKRGHEVTVITTDPVFSTGKSPKNFTEIDIHEVSYKEWKRITLKDGYIARDRTQILEFVLYLMTQTFQAQMKSPEIQNFLKSKKQFDLLIYESCMRPARIFSHIFDTPAIEISSLSSLFSNFDMMGAASHPLLYPGPMQQKIYNLSLWEKLQEIYFHYSTQRIYNSHEYIENEMLKAILGPNIPKLNDLAENVQLFFLNVHPLWDLNRPVPPNVLYLGGMHQKPMAELPQDLRTYLDSSKNGVIYMSFGTNVAPSLLPPEKIKIFADVFSRLSYDIILKWDQEEPSGWSQNIKIFKWLPQSDLLRHPKVKLFINQGGLQSTDEAITGGVPMIGIPFHGDQWFNTEQYTKFKIGIQLCLDTLTVEKLQNAISTIMDDSSFRENVIALRNVMNDQPQTPLDRAVWWTEHLLRHSKVGHLRTPAAGLTWAEYYELKLISILLLIFIVSFLCIIIVIKHLVSKIKYYMSSKAKTD